MANKFELPTDTGLAKKVIDSESKHTQLKIKAGWLGSFFGYSKNVGLYIVGLITIILLLTATIYTFIPDTCKSASLPADKFWSMILPVITTLIGYIFGFNGKGNNEISEE